MRAIADSEALVCLPRHKWSLNFRREGPDSYDLLADFISPGK